MKRLWSLRNWLKGFAFGPVQRCRACGHTSPYHYPTCKTIQWKTEEHR